MSRESMREKILMLIVDEVQPLQRDANFYKEKLEITLREIDKKTDEIYRVVVSDD